MIWFRMDVMGKRGEPSIIAESSAYLVVYKPSCVHTAPLGGSEEGSLLGGIAKTHPEVLVPAGRKVCEGGLLHRLDYETRGLVLVARTQAAFGNLFAQQENGCFVKEYEAISGGQGAVLPGFPPLPVFSGSDTAFIQSGFRSWGRGRAAVRPLEERRAREAGKAVYLTEVISRVPAKGPPGMELFRLRFCRGFRHQIRCHLAWIGYPILNDGLYGGAGAGGFLALTAASIAFNDPETGKRREYRLRPY